MIAADPWRLDGRVALVTGGGTGLGAAAATALAGAGAHVVVVGRRPEPLETEVAAIVASGGSAEWRQLDVADTAAVEQVFAEVTDLRGRLDVLVNNAAFALDHAVVDVTEHEWDSVLDANARGSFMCVREFLKAPARPGRSIVNLASLVSVAGVRSQAAYVASKGAVASLTRALAVELARDDIRVNAIAPGYFGTDMPASVLADERSTTALLRRIPMRRVGAPDEIGGAVLFLASPASSYVTGAIIHVDGGYTAQ
ncbi:SDR family NAD(P)-dependent oxidoreductase [Nocardioides humi]|uniref:Glucose 1-dehydrogenase n=1 Tax=Nocardioides humi TaxID=449461 RepID=A0ABN2ABF5_9ACTN|nr:SDR family oxidoreductase [Nocardioides humi]